MIKIGAIPARHSSKTHPKLTCRQWNRGRPSRTMSSVLDAPGMTPTRRFGGHMNRLSRFFLSLGIALTGLGLAMTARPLIAEGNKKLTPADGHTIHVTAPHMMDGKV